MYWRLSAESGMTFLFNPSIINTNKHVQFIIRALWWIIASLSLALVVAALVYRINRPWQFEESDYLAVARLGLTIPFYNAWISAQDLGLAIAWAFVGLSIFLLQPKDRRVLFFSILLLTFQIAGPPTFNALVRDHPGWRIPYDLVSIIGLLASYLSFYLFPDGYFVPRWTRWMAPVCLAWVILARPAKGLWNDTIIGSIGHLSLLLIGVAALTYRYRRVATPTQQQQIKWIVFALVLAAIGQVANELIYAFVVGDSGDWVFRMVVYHIFGHPFTVVGTQLFIALAMAFSILRYRLWDIDVVINRTLVYGVLTALIVGIYVLIVGGLGTFFQSQGNIAISLSAAGVVAVVFQPLRERLQRGVNRLIYGERDDPYTVLTRLGHRLESTLAPEAVFATIIQTVAESLKLPYASVELAGDDGEPKLEVAFPSSTESSPGELITLPLTYQSEVIGQLRLAPRAPGEPFSHADRLLLEDFARQAGVAAHAIRLTTDLQRARERIVTAREEERRRMRRDLHDGLGAQLAALNLQAGAIQKTVFQDPTKANAMLDELRTEIKASITNIRRIVYDLRPPALDELGLLSTLRDQVTHYADSGVNFKTELLDSLPALPAAVEVAVYRITQEALTNVARHSQAQHCTLRLALGDDLKLEISDDGTGLPADYDPGVGLRSMRERAEELGGRCEIQSVPGAGTRVIAHLPVTRNIDSGSKI
jgi:signal transduction histidine kinase